MTPLTAPLAGVDQWFGPRPQEAPRQDGDGLRQVPQVSQTVKKQGLSLQRCSLGLSSFPSGGGGNRCLPLGLGRSVEPQDCQGDLDTNGLELHAVHLALRHFLFWKGGMSLFGQTTLRRFIM